MLSFVTQRVTKDNDPSLARRVDQGEAVGDRGGLGAAADAELGEDAGDVDARRLLGHEEGGGDLAVGGALGEGRQHLALARGEVEGVRVAGRIGAVLARGAVLERAALRQPRPRDQSRHLGWFEAADLIISSMEKSIQQKRVTFDFARLMEGATQVSCSGFGQVMIENM